VPREGIPWRVAAALEASPPIFHIDRVARAIVLSLIIVDAYFLPAAFRACDHVIPLQKRVHLTLYMLTPAVPINRIGSGTYAKIPICLICPETAGIASSMGQWPLCPNQTLISMQIRVLVAL